MTTRIQDDVEEFVERMRESAETEEQIGNEHFAAIERHWADELEELVT